MLLARPRLEAGGVRGASGFALVAVVLLLLAVTAIGVGVLALARFELAASKAGADELVARIASEASALRLARDSLPEGPRGVGSAERWTAFDRTSGALRYSGTWVRAGREAWLAEGTAWVGPVGPVRSAVAVWALDPVARLADQAAVVVVGVSASIAVLGSIDGSAITLRPGHEPPEGCAPDQQAIDSAFPRRMLAGIAAAPDSVVATLGRLGVDSLAVLIAETLPASGTAGAQEVRGVCLTGDVWNWGDPLNPARPCGAVVVQRVRSGDLIVNGGVGQGLLVIDGDARLSDLSFWGMVVVRGHLVLDGTTRITGLVRARDGVAVGPAAAVVGSACWAIRAMKLSGLRGTLPVPGTPWLR